MFTSSYGSRRFAACDQGFHWGFFHPGLFFSRPVCPGYYEKSREVCVFWSDKLISNFNVFNNIKVTLHYSVYMRTSGESTHIGWSRTCLIGFVFSYKIIDRLIYSGV